jgi:uncharacterized protein YkwD
MSYLVGPQASFRSPFDVARRTSSPRRLAVAVAALFAITSIFAYASPSRTFGWDASSFSSSSEAQLVTLTNRSRANAGLKALKVDSTLTSVARWRSKDMITRDYFSHSIPGYGKVWDKLHAIGYCYKVAGENIGWNNYPDDIATAAIHDMFMNSAGHRANIMGADWDHIGVGAYKGPDGKKMWTVLFADKCGTTTSTPKPTAKPTARPTARPTVKSTPRPTPKPAVAKPAATPEPTPEPVETFRPDPDATAPSGPEVLLPPADESTPEPIDDGSIDTNGTPSLDPGDDTAGNGATGMRVVDDGGTDGLLQSIVGGVTGFFLGG